MFGFVSRKKYELLKRVNQELDLDISRLDKRLDSCNSTINNLKFENLKYEETIVKYDKEINKLKKECDLKEKQRRQSAGRCGNYKRKLNESLKEKKEMMDLINSLISERQQVMKLKKRPTVDEMRKYFKRK